MGRILMLLVAGLVLIGVWLLARAVAPPPFDAMPWLFLMGLIAFLRLNNMAGFGLVLGEGMLTTLWIDQAWFALPLAALLALGILWIIRHYMTHMSIYSIFGLTLGTTLGWTLSIGASSVQSVSTLVSAVWIALSCAILASTLLAWMPKTTVRL